MGILVNVAIGALAGVVGSLVGATVLGKSMQVPAFIVFALVGYFAGGILAGGHTAKKVTDAVAEWEDEDKAKKAKKAKKAAAEARKKEEASAAREAEAAAKAAAKKAEKKAAEKAKAKAAAKAAVVADSASESEGEEEVEETSAPKSKTAIKKAKAKAKEAAAKAAAEAAAKAAAKKDKKGGAAAAAAAAPAAAAPAKGAKAPAAAAGQTAQEKATAKAAAAAAAADLEGWETIEATKPTKSQLAKASATAAAPAQSGKGHKQESIPSSERPLTEEVIIPTKHHALIIGPKGATLNLLTSGSGAVIDMPKRDTASAKITITGTPAQVAVAKNAIQSLADRGFSNLTHPGTLSDDITVEPTNIGVIVGPNGATLRTIQEKTSTKINLPEKGSSSKKVTIVGEKEGVKAAKVALKSLIQDGFSTLTHEGWVRHEMPFPSDKFGILLGKNGQTIKSIQGQTKAKINLPEKGSKATTISIVGTPAAVAAAEKDINRLLEPLAPLPDPEEEDLATEDAWGQEHTAQGEDALWE